MNNKFWQKKLKCHLLNLRDNTLKAHSHFLYTALEVGCLMFHAFNGTFPDLFQNKYLLIESFLNSKYF